MNNKEDLSYIFEIVSNHKEFFNERLDYFENNDCESEFKIVTKIENGQIKVNGRTGDEIGAIAIALMDMRRKNPDAWKAISVELALAGFVPIECANKIIGNTKE